MPGTLQCEMPLDVRTANDAVHYGALMAPMELPSAWHLTPGGMLVLFAIVLCWIGAVRLEKSSDPHHRPWLRATGATVGLSLVLLCLDGPLLRASQNWLAWHMVSHVIVMFYVPVLLIVSGALGLMGAALDGRRGLRSVRRVGAEVGSVVGNALFAVLLFNGVMVLWHLPAVFDWHMANMWSTEWLMEPSFLLAGYLFWRLIVAGPNDAPRARRRVQVLAVLFTAFAMLVLAMWMSIGAAAPWYAAPVNLHGTTAALRDQHYAAGVLWVCGDLWAIPALVMIVLRVIEGRGGASVLIENLVRPSS